MKSKILLYFYQVICICHKDKLHYQHHQFSSRPNTPALQGKRRFLLMLFSSSLLLLLVIIMVWVKVSVESQQWSQRFLLLAISHTFAGAVVHNNDFESTNKFFDIALITQAFLIIIFTIYVENIDYYNDSAKSLPLICVITTGIIISKAIIVTFNVIIARN